MTIFRNNMFIESMNVSFMAFDSLKKNFTAEYTVEYFPSPDLIMNNTLSHEVK